MEPPPAVDPVGPFPPMLVYAGVMLLNLALLALVVTALVWAADRVEDLVFPGGTEWIDF